MENGIKNYLDNYLDYIMFEKKDCILKLKQDNNNICYKLKEETVDYELYEKTDKKNLNFNEKVIISIDRGVRNKFRKIKNKTELLNLNSPNANSQKYINQLLPIIFTSPKKNRHLTRSPNNIEPKTNFQVIEKTPRYQPSPRPTPTVMNRFQQSTGIITKPIRNTTSSLLNKTVRLLDTGFKKIDRFTQQKLTEYELYKRKLEQQKQLNQQKKLAKNFEEDMKRKLEEVRQKARNFYQGITKRGGGILNQPVLRFGNTDYYLFDKYIILIKKSFKNKIKNNENKQINKQQKQIENYLYHINWHLARIVILNYIYNEFYKIYNQSKFSNQEERILLIDSIYQEIYLLLIEIVNGIKTNNYQDLNKLEIEINVYQEHIKSFSAEFLNNLSHCQTSFEGTIRQTIGLNLNQCQKLYQNYYEILRQNYNIFSFKTNNRGFKRYNLNIEIRNYLSNKNIDGIENLIQLILETINIINNSPQYKLKNELYVLGGSN